MGWLGMRRKTFSTSLVGALLLAGCSDTERFSFDGADNGFCVPHDYVVEGPIWLTSDIVADDGGMAFRGCGQSYAGRCDIPLEISGGTLGPKDHSTWHTWADVVPGTVPMDTILGSLRDRTYRIIADDGPSGYRILGIPNPSAGATGVYYWRIPAEGEPHLEPSSELLAECNGVNDKRSPDAPEVAYQCTRTALMKDAVLHYHFWNGTVTTAFVTDLDKRLFAGIDSWRCK
jgi:hypothetical protein